MKLDATETIHEDWSNEDQPYELLEQSVLCLRSKRRHSLSAGGFGRA